MQYVHVHVYVKMCVCVNVAICVHACVCLHVYVSMSVCLCMRAHVCVCVCDMCTRWPGMYGFPLNKYFSYAYVNISFNLLYSYTCRLNRCYCLTHSYIATYVHAQLYATVNVCVYMAWPVISSSLLLLCKLQLVKENMRTFTV